VDIGTGGAGPSPVRFNTAPAPTSAARVTSRPPAAPPAQGRFPQSPTTVTHDGLYMINYVDVMAC
jgi:hypothetical protein